jgi:hypothetical protein
MAAINFDAGLATIVLGKYGQTTGLPCSRVKLYTAVAPALSKDTLVGHFTEVGAVMGYGSKLIGGSDFATVLDAANHWVTASASYTWIFTAGAGLTILGYYVTNTAGTTAILGEQFGAAVVIPGAGGNLQVNIADRYRDC